MYRIQYKKMYFKIYLNDTERLSYRIVPIFLCEYKFKLTKSYLKHMMVEGHSYRHKKWAVGFPTVLSVLLRMSLGFGLRKKTRKTSENPNRGYYRYRYRYRMQSQRLYYD